SGYGGLDARDWIEPLGFRKFSVALVGLPCQSQVKAVEAVGKGVTWFERNRLLHLFLAALPIAFCKLDFRQSRVSFAKVRVEAQQLLRNLFDLPSCFLVGNTARIPAVDFKQADIGRNELRIDLDCLIQAINRFLHALIGQSADIIPSLLIQALSLGV